MHAAQQLTCGPLQLDVQDERLWQGAQALRLRPKNFAVLRYLLECPGRLVAKEELLDGVWPVLAALGLLWRRQGKTHRVPAAGGDLWLVHCRVCDARCAGRQGPPGRAGLSPRRAPPPP